MKPKTAKEQFLELVEPELRTHYSRIIDRVATNENDPIIAMFAVVGWSQQTNAKSTQERIAAFEGLVGQVQDQLARASAENLKAVRREVASAIGGDYWSRNRRSKLVSACITLVLFILGTLCALFGAHWLLKEEQHEMLAQISNNPKGIVDFADRSLELGRSSNQQAAMMSGIACMLSTPDAQLAMRDGMLVVRVRSNHISVNDQGEYTLLTIHSPMPRFLEYSMQQDYESARKSLKIESK